MQLLFYTANITPRVEYIVSTLLKALGAESFQTTNNDHTFKSFNGAKINYSFNPIDENEYYLQPVNLLFEDEIKTHDITCFSWSNTKAFYKTEGDFPFDIFAASFYLLTRYEEYRPAEFDEYGRFAHKTSIASKEGFLHLPLINLWLLEFRIELQKKFPSLKFQLTPFQFTPTYDIDVAWSYLNKGVMRNVGGLIKSIIKGEWALVKERLEVLAGKERDPFDVFEWLDQLHHSCNLKPYYFFLFGKANNRYDRNIPPSNKALQSLIRNTAWKNNVGIHPSWRSGNDVSILKDEVSTLENIIGKDVIGSRQHYIRMMLPGTYRNLSSVGITEDYSMGYGSINGFRASYCLPFNWYDLEKEMKTNLLIYPFCWMEANAYFEQKFTLEQAKEELQHYYQITKEVNGLLITICHNHMLGNTSVLKGWKEMYEDFCINSL